MIHYSHICFALLTMTYSCSCGANGDDGTDGATSRADGATCPPGAGAPLDDDCVDTGLRCTYGYDPPECGGQVVECIDGRWQEVLRTEPQPACFDDAGLPDGQMSDGATSRADGATCPPGAGAPLDDDCVDTGLRCTYGYDPPECGGQVVECINGRWQEVLRTEPQPACFDDAGLPDGQMSDGSLGDCTGDPGHCIELVAANHCGNSEVEEICVGGSYECPAGFVRDCPANSELCPSDGSFEMNGTACELTEEETCAYRAFSGGTPCPGNLFDCHCEGGSWACSCVL